jgi:biopolymer transport protein ExbD
MARAKIPRKSTTVDMTAMCDVAFLLLTFFILTTKFKSDDKVPVNMPSSVANKFAPDKDVFLITMDKDGKVFLSMDEHNSKKKEVLEQLNNTNKLGLTDQDIAKLEKQSIWGVSLGNLKQSASLTEDKLGSSQSGIPVQDTANNQLVNWIRAAVDAYTGEKLTFLLKGDNVAKYPSFKNVIDALKKNDQLKFQMVTNPGNVPVGSEIWKKAQEEAKGGANAASS